MDPRALKIEDYSYSLPEDKIAQYPKEERDSSKLLIYDKGELQEDVYRNIAQYLPSDSLIVFNQTKVVQVRLLFRKATGGIIEIFCLEPDARYADMHTAMSQKSEVYWQCLVGGAHKWKNNDTLFLKDETLGITIEAHFVEKKEAVFIIHLTWHKEDISFAEVLQSVGKVPLPPYMHRDMKEEDKERYQTIYAIEEGSVAAPTAGLHFTPYIFTQFKSRNIHPTFITLHVGAGTFKQVKSEKIGEHDMHAEWIEVNLPFLEQLSTNLNSVCAVGTTSMRTIESLYWIGYKLFHQINIEWDACAVKQWDAYEYKADIDAGTAIQSLINFMTEQKLTKIITRTQIMIAPSYKAQITKNLITNFHQPNSTLLLLIAAITGSDWKMIYDYALAHDFRFLSYGDGCLIKFGA